MYGFLKTSFCNTFGLLYLLMLLFNSNIQYNQSIQNLVYSEIRFKPNKWFGPNAIFYIFHIK